MKIGHILFPVDFSLESRVMNKEAEWLASHFNAKVTLLHVFELPAGWYGSGEAPLLSGQDMLAYSDASKKLLEGYTLKLPEDRIERVSIEGNPGWEIASWSREHKVDLIIMGTHGYGSLRRLLLGSVALKVLHDVACPVWTHPVREDAATEERRISTILCALELGAEAVPLLRFVQGFAAEFGASVKLFHCVPETEGKAARYFDENLHEDLKGLSAEEIGKYQAEAGTDFPLELGESFITSDIAGAAEREHADLIIIGRGKAQSPLGTLRTSAFQIIREAPCPVLSFSMENMGVDWQDKNGAVAAGA